ncbi:hypothetical protein DB35_01525 [Streptomyces abyssalis]|uniref:Endonuclease/exonuclease/phosphatase domain-containing protein n=1 Tax=Streptomyces abyssalis TaxID=933944 RepID=A0A1E7JFF4_9ACTN|nr:hypothetical protein [Streptomyces abyssalis]OEU85190.1 hypothetical protein AN215_21450 [Streptomyces abyssalis]OEU95611.1 hypothetical protein DB35_01525 [Streptomyces abyssalis]
MEPLSRRRALALGGSAVLGTTGVLGGAAAAGAAHSEAKGQWQRLVVVTANIGRDNLGAREAAVRAVRRAVKDDGGFAQPLVGWQEIGGGDEDGKENRFIRKHFGSGYRNLFLGQGAARQVPMSVPRTFDVIDRRVTRAHGGKAGVSPHRVISQAVLELAADPRVRLVVANTHYVSGAWNNEDDPADAWRRKMWKRHFRKHRDDVLEHWHAKGFPVVWTGDVNRNPMPRLVPRDEKRAFPRGIDQIAWLPGTNGTELRLERTKTIPMHVDGHDARVAVMRIRRG